jgi:hypothetical protein
VTSGKAKTAAIAAFLGDSAFRQQNESQCCGNATVSGRATVVSDHRWPFSEDISSISAGWPRRPDAIAADCGKPAAGRPKLRKNKKNRCGRARAA